MDKGCLQAGAAALALATVLRLWAGVGGPETDRMLARTLVFLETGRVLSIRREPAVLPMPRPERPPETTVPGPEKPAEPPAVFSPADEQAVRVSAFCGYPYDVEALLMEPLRWNLKGPDPSVLIFHTHTTESYENTEGYPQREPYRCRDAHYNMVSVGALLGELLEEQGIRVLHDTTVHDEPSYNNAYNVSRQTAQRYLKDYPSLQLVLDLHRDAAEDSQGNQVATAVDLNGETGAKLMLVVGTDGSGLNHPRWRQNLALAVKLHAKLEALAPGICRPIAFRSQRFNQDLSPGALLIEIGTAGNTRQQALRSTQVLARALGELAQGSAWQEMS